MRSAKSMTEYKLEFGTHGAKSNTFLSTLYTVNFQKILSMFTDLLTTQ